MKPNSIQDSSNNKINNEDKLTSLFQVGNFGSIRWDRVVGGVITIGLLMAISFYIGHKWPVNITSSPGTISSKTSVKDSSLQKNSINNLNGTQLSIDKGEFYLNSGEIYLLLNNGKSYKLTSTNGEVYSFVYNGKDLYYILDKSKEHKNFQGGTYGDNKLYECVLNTNTCTTTALITEDPSESIESFDLSPDNSQLILNMVKFSPSDSYLSNSTDIQVVSIKNPSDIKHIFASSILKDPSPIGLPYFFEDKWINNSNIEVSAVDEGGGSSYMININQTPISSPSYDMNILPNVLSDNLISYFGLGQQYDFSPIYENNNMIFFDVNDNNNNSDTFGVLPVKSYTDFIKNASTSNSLDINSLLLQNKGYALYNISKDSYSYFNLGSYGILEVEDSKGNYSLYKISYTGNSTDISALNTTYTSNKYSITPDNSELVLSFKDNYKLIAINTAKQNEQWSKNYLYDPSTEKLIASKTDNNNAESTIQLYF